MTNEARANWYKELKERIIREDNREQAINIVSLFRTQVNTATDGQELPCQDEWNAMIGIIKHYNITPDEFKD